METDRNVEKLLSVFDLKVSNAHNIPRSVTVRVLFVYEKRTSTRRFIIVDTDVPRDSISCILSWLEKNIDVDYLASGLDSNRLDVSWSQILLPFEPG